MSSFTEKYGKSVVDKEGKPATISADCEYVGLYFSAHWCPPCRGFTPVLGKFYDSHHEAKKFEIVFVSSDRTPDAFAEYFKEMPWLALDYSNRDLKTELGDLHGVSGIPTFIILNAKDCSVVNADGRAGVSSDPEAAKFPWK